MSYNPLPLIWTLIGILIVRPLKRGRVLNHGSRQESRNLECCFGSPCGFGGGQLPKVGAKSYP